MSRFPDVALSVVIPAYNEERSIEGAVRAAVTGLRDMVGRFEILLIDDCSTDRTGALAEALSREFPEVRVVRNPVNLRQGGSLKRGFGMASMELVTHNAVDAPFDFADLPRLLQHFPQADVVVASRTDYPGVTELRKLMSLANRLLLRALFGLDLRDYNFIQIYRRDAMRLEECFSTATAFITPELIIRAHHAGRRVIEVAVRYHPRRTGKASSATWHNIVQALRDMSRLWLELRCGRKAKHALLASKAPESK